jgi:hypothetical protein
LEEKVTERRPIKSTTADLATVSSANGGDGEVTLASPLPVRLRELETRVSAALADAGARAASLSHLLQQVDWALPEAEQYAAAERDKSLDPTQSPDPRAARAASEDAQFAVGRLKTLQPRLLARYQQVYQQEAVREYLAKLGELAPERDALAAELHTTYEATTSKLIDLFQRVRTFEQQARSALGDPPPNVEVLARIDTRVLDKCVLPGWQHPDRNAWPPPNSFASDFALTMVVPQGPGAAWSSDFYRERRNAEIAAEHEKLALHAQARAKEQLARENEELKAQFQARQQNGRI